jgi:transmembrane protein 216
MQQTQNRPSAASFPLQLLLLTTVWTSPVWFCITLGLTIYKGILLPFPPAALPLEIIGVVALQMVQVFAFQAAKRGNLTETFAYLALGILLLIMTCGGLTYFMWFQTYVMQLDLAISAMFLALNGLSVLFCVGALSNIVSSANAIGAAAPGQQTQQQQTQQQQQQGVPQDQHDKQS